ncbi:hypothetical protein ACIHCQ_33765 [Streptomyces sp. NPDC052236]|uniref:hypothetical protein n=1 Tax=Streptomyces sp. NPDC052236 TaxID=3365686 RepID=UPI0037D768E1
MQAGVGDDLGHQQQDIIDGRLLLLVRGGQPPPVGQGRSAEIATTPHHTLGAEQGEPTGLPLRREDVTHDLLLCIL